MGGSSGSEWSGQTGGFMSGWFDELQDGPSLLLLRRAPAGGQGEGQEVIVSGGFHQMVAWATFLRRT